MATPYLPAPTSNMMVRPYEEPSYGGSSAYGAAGVPPNIPSTTEAVFTGSASSYARRRRATDSSFATIAKIVVGGAVGLAIGWLIVNRLIVPLQEQREIMRNPKRALLKNAPPTRPLPGPQQGKTQQQPLPAPLPDPMPRRDADSTPQPPATDPQQQIPQNAPEAPPAPAPVETNPFAKLAKMIALPEFEVGATLPLAPFACVPAEKLTIALDSAFVDLDGASLTIAPAPETESAWIISREIGDSEASVDTAIAQLTLRGATLELDWIAPETDSTKQLANCCLHLSSGPYRHDLQLRHCMRRPCIEIDLDAARQSFKLDLLPWPDQRVLSLSIEELIQFPEGAKLRGNKSQIQLGQEAAIEFDEMPGATIDIKFGRQADGTVAVIVSPMFKEKKGGEFELSFGRLEETTESAEEALEAASSAIRRLTSQLSSLESDYNSLLSTTPLTTAEQLSRSTTLDRLRSRAQTVRSRLRNLQREVPELQARISSAPAMREFLTSLHRTGRIKLRILAESATHELSLVEFVE